MRKVLMFVVTIVATGGLLAGAVVLAGPQLAAIASAGSGDPQELDLDAFGDYAVRSQVFASDGTLLATLHGDENREPIALADVPQPVVQSILAIEDAEFYQHRGVNARALARALVENVSAGGVEQGGSTITQQLVKNALLTNERSLERKTREAVLALRLEQEMTKDEILETYLNTVYFGSGAYGVQAAAETYWGRNVQELSWAEGAMLAALISNPVAYDPTLYPEEATAQRAIAVDRLVSLGLLSRDDADYISYFPVPTARCGIETPDRPEWCGEVALTASDGYFVEYVKLQLLADERLGATYAERYKAVFGGGLAIHTTLDPAAQFAAEVAHAEETPANDVGVTSAFVAVDQSTGAVRALVGGADFATDKFDIATTDPGRQTGSTFKTFVLLEALEQGALPFDTVSGTITMTDPGTLQPYTVTGAGGTLQSVLSASSNAAFVRLNQVVGPERVVARARSMGVDLPDGSEKKPSLPLGVADTTPLEMATAYGAIPNGGIENPAYFVERVENRNGEVLFSHRPEGVRVISEQTACLATDILAGNVEGGTGRNAALPDQVSGGKTGTTTGPTDVWFVGFTPYLTTAVWMGNPKEGGTVRTDPSGRVIGGGTSLSQLPGRQAWGSTYPAAIWQRFNELYHEDRPSRPFPDCAPPTRSGRPLSGANDPFGTLNGGYDRSGVGVISGPMKGNTGRSSSSGTRPTSPTTTAPSAVDGDAPVPAPAPAPAPVPAPAPPPG
ncbi:MAG: transglycosylase domain-containing protein [Acidimicrobiales bacterium]|nr:transglycosylase domain-containing protein [Acidimicrobiales bacterium]